MDTDGNKKLSPQELRRGLNDMYVCERLSKLVCYHQSEWGVNYSSLKQELETLLDKGIEQEEDEEIKEHFIRRKENSLKVIEDKVNALDFWSKVKVPGNEMPEGWTYDPILNKSRKMHPYETQSNPQPRGENELEPFPSDTKVYHFHPNAFVEQMRRVNFVKIGYVDWEFIKEKEGKEVLLGYVPTKTVTEEIVVTDKDGKVVMKAGKEVKKKISKKVAIGKSGVTIASGFDIGQHNKYDIERIFKSEPTLKTKYLPYVDKKKQVAIDYLKQKPLSITKEEAELTDKLIKESRVNALVKVYNKYEMPKEFKFQSVGIQTVVMSISFQYGIYSRALKGMWEALKSGNDEEVIDFWEDKAKGTSYQKRRQSELEYLKSNIKKFK